MSTSLNPGWPKKSFRSGDFNVKMFLDVLATKGYRVSWEQASECPCRANSDSDQALATCPVCAGERYEYQAPVETRVAVTDLSADPQVVQEYGHFISGVARVTLRGELLPSRGDRFTLLDSFRRVTVIRARSGSGKIDTLRLPVAVRTGLGVGPATYHFNVLSKTPAVSSWTAADPAMKGRVTVSLEYPNETNLTFQVTGVGGAGTEAVTIAAGTKTATTAISWTSVTRVELIAGTWQSCHYAHVTTPPVTQNVGVTHLRLRNASDQGGAVLVQDVDFGITATGAIDWTLGDIAHTAPTAGGWYAVTYYTHPRYAVINLPHVIRDTQMKMKYPAQIPGVMPVQCYAKLDNRGTTEETPE